MADDTNDRRKGGPAAGAPSAAKRPFATLDLKATEIKITPVQGISKSPAAKAAQGTPMPQPNTPQSLASEIRPEDVPTPAPAWTYAVPGSAQSPTGRTTASSAATGTAKPGEPPANVIIQKRGGFFSHLAASIVGGLLATAGLYWALPQLGITLPALPQSNDTAAIAQRLQAIEKHPGNTADLEARLAALEKSTSRIPALLESQTRLVADTKAALASTASDTGVPELLTRLSTLEDKLKTVQDASATGGNTGGGEQITALAGKVSELENTLATQIADAKKTLTSDVDQRLADITAATATAKSGAERFDKDIAGMRSETATLSERLAALKDENSRLAATAKLAAETSADLKSDLRAVKESAASPADLTSAVEPLNKKLAALESQVKELTEADEQRRAEAERAVFALQLQNLKRALDSGRDYAPELAAVKEATSEKFDLAPLAAHADEGVPSKTDLQKDFRTAANAAIDAEAEPADGNVVDRFLASAKSIVRVRQVDHPVDDKSTEAIVGRMQLAIDDGRFADALHEAQTLPAKAAAAAKPYVDRVAARVSIDQAIAKIEDQLKASAASDSAGQEE